MSSSDCPPCWWHHSVSDSRGCWSSWFVPGAHWAKRKKWRLDPNNVWPRAAGPACFRATAASIEPNLWSQEQSECVCFNSPLHFTVTHDHCLPTRIYTDRDGLVEIVAAHSANYARLAVLQSLALVRWMWSLPLQQVSCRKCHSTSAFRLPDNFSAIWIELCRIMLFLLLTIAASSIVKTHLRRRHKFFSEQTNCSWKKNWSGQNTYSKGVRYNKTKRYWSWNIKVCINTYSSRNFCRKLISSTSCQQRDLGTLAAKKQGFPKQSQAENSAVTTSVFRARIRIFCCRSFFPLPST